MNEFMKRLVLVGGLSATLLAAPVWADQKLVASGSQIKFVVKQMGVPVEGGFKRYDTQIDFNPKAPQTSKVKLAIDLASAGFGVPETDVELPKATWFNTAKFPKATFDSTAVKATGAGKFDVAGKLTIKGVSQNVNIPVTIVQSGPNSVASGAFTIKRSAYKIGDGEWSDTSIVADDVQVKFKLTLTGMPAL